MSAEIYQTSVRFFLKTGIIAEIASLSFGRIFASDPIDTDETLP